MGFSFAVSLFALVSCLTLGPMTAVAWPSDRPNPAAAPRTSNDAAVAHWSKTYRIPASWVRAVWAYESHIRLGKFTRLNGPRRELWLGIGNPGQTDPASVAVFDGVGRDGDGDGQCDLRNPYDRTCAVLDYLARGGRTSSPEIRRGLWEWYRDGAVVERITAFSSLFATHSPEELKQHAFPLPLRSDYTYRDTWGEARGWGGRRIHVGTDLFAPYGTPVHSTAWGYVENKGWNSYGGWRVGIRDISNTYHYFAHLSGFAKGLHVGEIVKPGQVVGYVGSSGYGRKGTSGKFPPHLHYGLYVDAGSEEWPINPYPHLTQWEREERKQAGRPPGIRR
ncbi:MAG: M23 family metallopeptidase [Kyrpidia sp.]|nr:M23 family metallopeptidase [Kyrpidia sp.]